MPLRRFVALVGALVIVVTGFVAAPPAQATSEYCRDSWPVPGTTDIVTWPVYVSVEHWVSPAGNDFFVGACVSDTPPGTQSMAYGSFFGVHVTNVGPGRWDVTLRCEGDASTTGLLTTYCRGTTSTTATLNTTSGVGFTLSGFQHLNGNTLTIGTTGANAGTVNTTTASNPDATWSGTCATVLGITPPTGTLCSSFVADGEVALTDLPNLGTGGSTSTCLVTVGGTCHLYAPRAFVEGFADTYNPTYVDVLGAPVVTDPGRICIGFGC